MSVMQTSQEQSAQPELEQQHGAAPQKAAADRDGLTELLAKVP